MYLVDTCALLWFLDDNPSLSLKARDVIGKSNTLYVSIVSLWEIAIKKQLESLNWKKLSPKLQIFVMVMVL